MRKVVDLPAPFGPSSPKISPRCTVKLTWSTATNAPKRRTRSCTSMAGVVAPEDSPSPCGSGLGEGRRLSRPLPKPLPRGGGVTVSASCRGSQPCDKAVLEAWRQGVQRDAAEVRRRRAPRHLAQHDAQRVAGDQRVQHRRILRRAPGDGAAAARRHGQAEHPAAQRRQELVRRRVGQQLALVQQQHAAAAGGLVEIGGGPDHGHAVGAAFLQHGGDDRPEFAARQRIDADRRLVQQQQARAGQQRAGQAELLLHAAGQLARQPRGEWRQAGEAQQPRDARGAQIARHGMQVGEQVEVFRDAEVLVQAERLRHIADRGMHRGCVGRHVVAEHRARCRRVGRSRPAISRSSVVLPAPSGPTRPVMMPGSMRASMPSSATASG